MVVKESTHFNYNTIQIRTINKTKIGIDYKQETV